MQQPPYHSPQRPPSYTVRPIRMDGWTRILLVGGAAALAGWFAVSYWRGDITGPGSGSIGARNHSGIEPRDVFGFRPATDQAGVPDGYGYGRGEAEPPRQRRTFEAPIAPGRGSWRICDDQRRTCGPWQDGPPPRHGREIPRGDTGAYGRDR